MSVTIRTINKDEKDFKYMLQIGDRFIDAVDLPELFPLADSYERSSAIESLFFSQFFTGVIAINEDVCIGGLGVFIVPYMWDRSKTSCEEIFWWVDPDAPKMTALRMLKMIKNMAKSRGVDIMAISCMKGSPDSLDRIYRKMGFKKIQSIYMGVV